MARILVVDDEQPILDTVQKILTLEGYDVQCAHNGAEALHVLQEGEFQVMLSDIRMTPVDGMHLLARAHKERPHLAVILLTAYASLDTATESLQDDIFDYLLKPVRVGELLDTVAKAVEYNRLLLSGGDREKAKADLGRGKSLKEFLRSKEEKFSDNVPKFL